MSEWDRALPCLLYSLLYSSHPSWSYSSFGQSGLGPHSCPMWTMGLLSRSPNHLTTITRCWNKHTRFCSFYLQRLNTPHTVEQTQVCQPMCSIRLLWRTWYTCSHQKWWRPGYFPRFLNQSFGLCRAWHLFKQPVSLDIWHAPSYICLKHAWKKVESLDVFLCQYRATKAMSNFGPDGSLYDL